MKRLALLFALCAAAPARADDLLMLEAGRFETLAALRASADEHQQRYAGALQAFYGGQLSGALMQVRAWPNSMPPETQWLKSYIEANAPYIEEMVETQSEHFALRTRAKDRFLHAYALDALEKAYAELGKDFGVFPKERIRVEIYPDQETFSRASTLSKETLERSGAIGICKFRRLMILSPSQLAYGYRWLDTLSHEYAHYLINVVSGGRCPLWMHEGVAKHFETRWRLEQAAPLTPGNRSELARALKDGKIIPFKRMEPSMVYLDDQAQVRQAFSQVSHAIETIERTQGKQAIVKILSELATGKSRDEAFLSVLKMDTPAFEKWWTEQLSKSGIEESPGAAPDIWKFGSQTDEVEELVSVSAQAHLRLGDRLRKAEQPDAARIQYEKALKQEPNNPVVLTKLARLHLAQGRKDSAIELLRRCIAENPNYATAFVLLAEQLLRDGEFDQAKSLFIEAIALNPYDPSVHARLADIYDGMGDPKSARVEREAVELLSKRNSIPD